MKFDLRQALSTLLVVMLVLLAFRGLHTLTGTPTKALIHDIVVGLTLTIVLVLTRLPRR